MVDRRYHQLDGRLPMPGRSQSCRNHKLSGQLECKKDQPTVLQYYPQGLIPEFPELRGAACVNVYDGLKLAYVAIRPPGYTHLKHGLRGKLERCKRVNYNKEQLSDSDRVVLLAAESESLFGLTYGCPKGIV